MFTRLKPLLLIVAGGMLGGSATHYLGPPNVSFSSNPALPSPAAPPRAIRALGSIQPREGIVDVAIPAGLMLVRVESKVKEGSWVNENELLAILDGYDQRNRELDVLDVEMAAATEALAIECENECQALAEIDRERQRALHLGNLETSSLARKILALEAKYCLADQQLKRVKGLERDGTVAPQQYEQIRAQSEISREELGYAQAEKARVEGRLP